MRKKVVAKKKVTKTFDVDFVLIAGDKKLDKMMHSFDVFEPFKALADITQMVITLKNKPTDKKLEEIFNAIREGYEKQDIRVVALFCPGNKVGAYLDTTVKVISNGKKFGMLADALKAYGYTDK